MYRHDKHSNRSNHSRRRIITKGTGLMVTKDKRIVIAYIGGGSVNYGWKIFSELAAEEICAEVRLYDVDKQLALANETIGNKLREHPDCKRYNLPCFRDSRGRACQCGHRHNVLYPGFNRGNGH